MAVLFRVVWFKVKLHVKDPKTVLDKKKYVAFWLEQYAKKEPGMPLTVVFDMTESGISNIVSHLMQAFFLLNGYKNVLPSNFTKYSTFVRQKNSFSMQPHLNHVDRLIFELWSCRGLMLFGGFLLCRLK